MIELAAWIAKWYQVISVVFGILAALGVLSAILYRWYSVRAQLRKKDGDYKRWVRDQLKALDGKADRMEERQAADKQRQNKQSDYAKTLSERVDAANDKSSEALGIAQTLRVK